MENTVLSHYASINAEFLHGAGMAGTEQLFSYLPIHDHQNVLEIGFGTGASLVRLKGRFPDLEVCGIEASELMLQKAKKRFRWSGLSPTHLKVKGVPPYPFEHDSFDIIYIESVLAILSLEKIDAILTEIFRLLKPGGHFGLNETIWLPEISSAEISRINDACFRKYGIIQSNEELEDANSWASTIESKGFKQLITEPVVPKAWNKKTSWVEKRSRLFTLFGKINGKISAKHRKVEQEIMDFQNSLFEPGKAYMTGHIFVYTK
ncbi:MAG: class I SAM-dependent methyltransferase [Bacteroidota bacterium]